MWSVLQWFGEEYETVLSQHCIATISTYLLKMRSSSNPKIGVPATGQIKLQGKSYGNSNGEQWITPPNGYGNPLKSFQLPSEMNVFLE